MKKLLFPIFVSFFLASVVLAHDSAVDTVILASTANYPDAEVARAASYNEGTPILLIDANSLSDDVKATLADLEPTNVVIVGGPAVVSADVETELTTLGYSVTRLWGTTGTGTAAEVATNLNPEGADAVVLVVDDSNDNPSADGDVLADVSAQTQGEPILLVSSDGVPAATADALSELGTKEVTVVGDLSAEAEQKLDDDLKDSNVAVKEKIKGKKAEIRAKLKAKFEAKLNVSETLLVVANGNGHKDGLAGSGLTGHVFHVRSESQIQEVVDLVNAKAIKNVKVVGNPTLGAKIVAALNATTANVTSNTGDVRKIVSELVKEKKEKLKERFDERKKVLKEKRDAAKAKIKEKATQLWERLNNLETKPQGLQTVLDRAKQLIESDPQEALKVLRKAVHVVKKANFEAVKDKVEDLREEVKKEREDLKARVEALTEFNKEFADKLKGLLVEDRLKAIKELNLERKERVRAIVEAANGNATLEHVRELRKEKEDKLKQRKDKLREKAAERKENKNSRTSADVSVNTTV